jgi:hypothetical protein
LFACAGSALMMLVSCAATIPKAELDRCSRGVADGNDAFQMRQGAACRMVAQRLAADDNPTAAMGYASKACQLQDARGCEQYLALARGRPSLPPDELLRARTAGEKACAGMVVDAEGTDARPGICVRTAELYLDVEPRSRGDAGRLYARACSLGDDKSCGRAKTLGVEPEDRAASSKAPPNSPVPPPPPKPIPGVTGPLPAAQATTCHSMRSCVALDVHKRGTEVVGTLTNHCDSAVSCSFCPAQGDRVEKGTACRTTSLARDESKTGRDAGLWYQGYTAIAYDCMDANDERGCSGM